MHFALAVLFVVAAGLVALLSNRITELLRVPAAALLLAAAAVVSDLVPGIDPPPERIVGRIVTVALLVILFDGGMHIGWSRLRSALVPVSVLGVAGTFLTVAGAALVLHLVVRLPGYESVLVATAVSPTDPAVVFSVLGRREIAGRSGTVLEGESGANDPVGIALMAGLLSVGGLSGSAFGHVALDFVTQMAVGLAVGLLGGLGLLWFTRQVPLPSEGLYPLRTIVSACGLYAVATLAHGSGFLAVFVAGLVMGDQRTPYKREIEHVFAALASVAEVVAFVVLGLTVELDVIGRLDVWLPGVLLGSVGALVIRPLVVSATLLRSGLAGTEKAFVAFAGLKGAVPILLGGLILEARVGDAPRLYGIVVIVVVFSVVVQGSLVPTVAHVLRVPMRIVPPAPWTLGVRLRDEPDGVLRLTVADGSLADGSTLGDLHHLPADAWISLVVRQGRLVSVRRDVRLLGGDEVLIVAEPDRAEELRGIFERRIDGTEG